VSQKETIETCENASVGILTGLNAEAIGQMSATRIKALSMADIAGMTAEQLPGLTATQTALFSPLQLLALSKPQIPNLSPAAVAGFSPGQLALLAPLGAFTPLYAVSTYETELGF
jgi:hypothetical protein